MSSNVTRSNSETDLFNLNSKNIELGLAADGVELRRVRLHAPSETPPTRRYETPPETNATTELQPTPSLNITSALEHHRRRELIAARYECDEEPRSFERNWGPFTIRFNPVVTIVSIILIWTFVAVAIAKSTEMNDGMNEAKQWITANWTWLYIGAFDIWLVFVLVVFFSKYSHIRLGADHETAEFSDTSYFTMLFAAGVGPGLFYFAVAEPIMHYDSAKANRYNVRGYVVTCT